jgi:hypothetical protein
MVRETGLGARPTRGDSVRRWGALIAVCALCACATSGPMDAGIPDGALPDSGSPDGSIPDAGSPDGSIPDAGLPDGSIPDAGGPDAGMPEAIDCATLASSPTLDAGQNWLLDLAGGPACTLTAATDLVLSGSATQLTVLNGTLEVQGNLTLSGSSAFTVRQGTLQIDNVTSFTRNISAADSASFILDHATLVTNATGVNNVGSVYVGSGSSSAQFHFANLDLTTSWLLASMTDSASLYAGNSNVPAEIYLGDSSQVQIQDDQVASDPRATNGLWLRFEDGATATVVLPDVSGPFSWQAGRGQAGYTNVSWYLEVDTATPGIGIEPHAGSAVTVDGRAATQKEVGFGIYVDPAAGSPIANALAGTPYALTDPPLGLVADFSLPTLPGASASQLTLHDVNLGALAWQVYVGGGTGSPPVTVNLGTGAFNEVVAFAGGQVNLSATTTQLAVLQAEGPGSVVNATGADLWSQTIQADSQGQVNLIGSVVHGGSLVASAGGTLQLDDTTALWADGVTTAPDCAFGDDYAWMLAHAGRPICNPFARPTQLSSRTVVGAGSTLMPSQIHPACPWVGDSYAPALLFEVGPPVTAAAPGSLSCVPTSGTTATGSISAYPFLLNGLQPLMAYACTLTVDAGDETYSATTSDCAY